MPCFSHFLPQPVKVNCSEGNFHLYFTFLCPLTGQILSLSLRLVRDKHSLGHIRWGYKTLQQCHACHNIMACYPAGPADFWFRGFMFTTSREKPLLPGTLSENRSATLHFLHLSLNRSIEFRFVLRGLPEPSFLTSSESLYFEGWGNFCSPLVKLKSWLLACFCFCF